MFVVSDPAKKKYEKTAVEQLATQLIASKLPSYYAPVQVTATFYREKNLGDLIGFMQMLADCLEKAGIVENDRLVMSWDGTRMSKDADNPRTELEVTAL